MSQRDEIETRMKDEIQKLYNVLKKTPIDLFSYDGEMKDIAFDITLTDSYVAGIADRIVNNEPPLKNAELKSLHYPFVVDGQYWWFKKSRKVDLEPFPDLLKLATLLETLRIKCLNFLKQGH